MRLIRKLLLLVLLLTVTGCSAQVIPVQPTPQPIETWSSTSPDGKWIAQGRAEFPATRGGNATYHVQLQVTTKDSSQTWTLMDKTLPYQAGYATPEVFYWSQDNARLYFANLPHPDGCVLLFNARDLQRIDLATGRVQMIAPQVGYTYMTLPIFLGGGKLTSITGYLPALSQDEAMVAYIAEGYPLRVVFRDVAKGIEQQAELGGTWSSDDSQAGALHLLPTWASDGNYTVMLSIFDHPCDPTHRNSAIVKVEITSRQAILRHYDQWLMRVVKWVSTSSVGIEDGEGHHDEYNLRCPTGCTGR